MTHPRNRITLSAFQKRHIYSTNGERYLKISERLAFKNNHSLKGQFMDDFLDDIPINGDDVVINLNFLLVYKAHNNSIGLCNDLFQKEIKTYFNKYTYNNCVRIKDVLFDSDSIVFFIKQVNPDIAMQEIIDDIDNYLSSELERYSIKQRNDDWEIIEIFSIGDPEEVKKDIDSYLRNLRFDDDESDLNENQ
jgi:hypothetical protein